MIIQAHRMEALFESGAAVAYPDFYTTLEWEAFLALKGARAKDSEKDFPKKKVGVTDTESEIQRMEQRLARG